MKIPRRQFLHLAAGAAALPLAPQVAWAQAYPTRPVRILVGFAAGGGADVFARLMAQWLSERLGQQFIVENRLGASSNIAIEAAVKALPDGYTLVVVGTPNAVNATLYEKLNFDLIKDVAPIAGIIRLPFVLMVNSSSPAKTVPEFIAYAKANRGKVNFGSGGSGSTPHIAAELFRMMAGVDMVHVPYRGEAPALTDLLGGQLQMMFASMSSAVVHARAGTLRPLAVTTATRSEALPDVPALSDFLPGYEASYRGGICGPRNTPTGIIDKLNKEINAALADPKIKARLAEMGGTALVGSSADFGKLIEEETEKWAKVIKFANIKPE
ncbi:MAG TPA: tripartite tricarboxylate transporter substrate binding protein [Xanthobacteraceae bacterium]